MVKNSQKWSKMVKKSEYSLTENPPSPLLTKSKKNSFLCLPIAPLYHAFNDTNNIFSESISNNIKSCVIFIDSTF